MDSIITVILVAFAFMSAYKVAVASSKSKLVYASTLVGFFGLMALGMIAFMQAQMAQLGG